MVRLDSGASLLIGQSSQVPWQVVVSSVKYPQWLKDTHSYPLLCWDKRCRAAISCCSFWKLAASFGCMRCNCCSSICFWLYHCDLRDCLCSWDCTTFVADGLGVDLPAPAVRARCVAGPSPGLGALRLRDLVCFFASLLVADGAAEVSEVGLGGL